MPDMMPCLPEQQQLVGSTHQSERNYEGAGGQLQRSPRNRHGKRDVQFGSDGGTHMENLQTRSDHALLSVNHTHCRRLLSGLLYHLRIHSAP
jgi:hypothetical protein